VAGFEPATGGFGVVSLICHLLPSDSVTPRLVWRQATVCIWLCHPVLGGAKQFVGKKSAKTNVSCTEI